MAKRGGEGILENIEQREATLHHHGKEVPVIMYLFGDAPWNDILVPPDEDQKAVDAQPAPTAE